MGERENKRNEEKANYDIRRGKKMIMMMMMMVRKIAKNTEMQINQSYILVQRRMQDKDIKTLSTGTKKNEGKHQTFLSPCLLPP